MIGQAALRVVDQFFSPSDTGSERQQWVQAARTLRLPYWDWTDPRTATEGLPGILLQPILNIAMPGGRTVPIPNVLEHYTFGGKRPSGFADQAYDGGEDYYSVWDRTYRWPSSSSSSPTQDYGSLN